MTVDVPEKEDKPTFEIEGCFSIRVTDAKAKRALMYTVKNDAVHARNMVSILRNQLYEAQKTNEDIREVYKVFINDRALRAAVYGRKGGGYADKVALIRSHFKSNDMFIQLCEHAQTQLDSKSFYSILGALKSQYKQFVTNIKAFVKNPDAYKNKFGNDGAPRPPKAKKIATISHASLSLDREKWRLIDKVVDKKTKETRPFIRIKCAHKHSVLLPINWHHFPVPEGKILRALNINVSNDAVYLNFTYGHVLEKEQGDGSRVKQHKKKKWAAGDVGMINVLSVLVDDLTTPSLVLCGNQFKNYNVQFNRHKARLDKEIAGEAIEFKTILSQDKEIEIAIEHSELGNAKKRLRTHIIEKRNRFFQSEFDKLSRRLVEYLLAAGVTDLALSKNLSFLKTASEKTKLQRKTRQQFYHLPFGKLLNLIQSKCDVVGIKTHFINEAYTSKTSCFSGDVRSAKARRDAKKQPLSTTDCQGSRVKRGLYKDHKLGLKFHADINGAINHIKVADPDYDPIHLLENKQKLCNPIRIKSDYFFAQLNEQRDSQNSTDGCKTKLAA